MGASHGHDHDHARCRADALAQAEARCRATGGRLTPIRRLVLDAILETHAPVGAYEIIDRLAAAGHERPAPITVYRALDFLRAQGLVHRVDSRNGFIACDHSHGPDETVVILLCDGCHDATEVATTAVSETIAAAASRHGFAVRQPVIEIGGLCSTCAGRTGRRDAFKALGPKPLGRPDDGVRHVRGRTR